MNALKWLSSRSPMISDRLDALVRTTLFGFGFLVIATIAATEVTILRVGTQSGIASYARELQNFNVELLQMRRNEKDFLERRTKEELDKHAASYQKAQQALDEAKDESGVTRDELLQIDKLKKVTEAYRNAFVAAADVQLALGGDENSGLQGVLRKAVRDAEEIALGLKFTELEVGVLTLRRHEKDFILREREEYVTRHAKEMGEVRQLIAGAKLDGSTRQRLEERLNAYEKAFSQFVAATFAVNKAVKTARDLARSAEEPLPGLLADADERRAAITTQVRLIQTGALIGVALVLALVGWLLTRNLGLVRRSINSSVSTLQGAIQSVRDGAGLGALAKIETRDELGEVGFGVNQLLQAQISQREEADESRQKAEAENERLNNSVISILQAVNLLSQRDLTARAPVTQDIIGTVSDSINALTDETSRVLSGVSLIAAQVAAASGKVKSQGDLVSKTAEDERLNVGRMINSLTESTQTTNQMATLAAQSNQSAEQATMATDNALETVNGTVKGMESIRETIAETEKRIKRLGERAQEITGIVSLINTISERTHVLALNASMQAAVAGEAGRGFAVVAEEVQRLAESSRNATQQIGTLVSNIQLETNETINTVNRTIDQVVKGSEQAQKAGKEMRRTQEVTAQLVSQVKRIAEGSELQKEMSANLLASVHAMGKSNERTAAQIGTQNVETESLQASARRLVESVNVFKLPQAA